MPSIEASWSSHYQQIQQNGVTFSPCHSIFLHTTSFLNSVFFACMGCLGCYRHLVDISCQQHLRKYNYWEKWFGVQCSFHPLWRWALINGVCWSWHYNACRIVFNFYISSVCVVGLGDMAQKMITIIIFISVDIDNYHDKCQIFISFKFKFWFLLQSESFRNQTINFP